MEVYSLLELNGYIKRVFKLNFPDAIWVSCEIARYGKSGGHHYLELVQKEESDKGKVLAQSDAVLWSRNYSSLHRRLGNDLNTLLQVGTEIKIKVHIDFHERYGFKLIIDDIDISYTLGKLELQRKKIIEQLQKLGLTDNNPSLSLPPVIQKIAVLSSPNAAGLQDFMQHLMKNPYQYQFRTQLFPTAVQGERVERELLRQFEAIKKLNFDCVVIIRGGGGRIDLSAFDNFEIGKAIALCHFPVFTGIGHDIDQTIPDLVAHHAFKTPTAVADFIVRHNLDFESEIEQLGQAVSQQAFFILESYSRSLRVFEKTIPLLFSNILVGKQHVLEQVEKSLRHQCETQLMKNSYQLIALEKMSKILNPDTILQGGYSITEKNGKIITAEKEVKKGDQLITHVKSGQIKSIVE
ncbi:MAG: exodeoxyribonuclease VII large subunit [Bacteroidetes bacterium]|nr:exodeoxyribonuclease VII large subunit [Bacteroidota bacterium]